jgi:hypothetical protein
MMIEMGKKYQTRDGRAVRILCVDGPDPEYPVVGWEEGNVNVLVWKADGRYNPDVSIHADLIPVPTKHEGWLVISWISSGHYLDGEVVWNSYEEAVEQMNRLSGIEQHIAHVTWED